MSAFKVAVASYLPRPPSRVTAMTASVSAEHFRSITQEFC